MSFSPPSSIQATMLIRKPAADVFEAFVDPAITTRFWFDRSSGRLTPQGTATWYWDHYGVSADVKVVAFEPGRRLVIEWPTRTEWDFKARDNDGTLVTITASGFTGSPDEQVRQALDNTEGFNLVLAACKAWLEFGVQLHVVADKAPDARPATGP